MPEKLNEDDLKNIERMLEILKKVYPDLLSKVAFGSDDPIFSNSKDKAFRTDLAQRAESAYRDAQKALINPESTASKRVIRQLDRAGMVGIQLNVKADRYEKLASRTFHSPNDAVEFLGISKVLMKSFEKAFPVLGFVGEISDLLIQWYKEMMR